MYAIKKNKYFCDVLFFLYTVFYMNNKGFTLIELLVVVAIIGVLASMVMSSLNSARSRALDARALAQVTQLQTAIETYILDNDTVPQILPAPTNCGYPLSFASRSIDQWEQLLSMVGLPEGAIPYAPECAPCFIYYHVNGTYQLRVLTIHEQENSLTYLTAYELFMVVIRSL